MKVVMFIRDELYSGEWERNNNFREIVKRFVPFMIEEPTFYETTVNTPSGYQQVVDENPDCEIVITTENAYKTQYEFVKRGFLVFEWRCFTNPSKIVPVTIKVEDGVYTTSHYGIRTPIPSREPQKN